MKAFLSILITASLAECSTGTSTATRIEKQNPAVPSITTALQQYHDGQLDSALSTLRAILGRDPKNAGAFYYLRLVNTGRYNFWVKSLPLDKQQELNWDWERQHWGPRLSPANAVQPTAATP